MVTSIAGPNGPLAPLAAQAVERGFDFIVIGDEASPAEFNLEGCDFYGLDRQLGLSFELARLAPVAQYARKNLGYLLAMQCGATPIVETDDDTVAFDTFWAGRTRRHAARTIVDAGWFNIYRYFSDGVIWPRGLPLEFARSPVPPYDSLPEEQIDCPIQQGLVDEDPDVDAIYRLLFDLPIRFEPGPSIALTGRARCPFNSQNTAWWPEAYPLMYLPASCTTRMTDIWRSFVAQTIAGANGWGVLYHQPTISQTRNPHDLMRDFRDEVPGYLESRAICAALDRLEPRPGAEHVGANLLTAYELLVERSWLDERELTLVAAWLSDLESLRPGAAAA